MTTEVSSFASAKFCVHPPTILTNISKFMVYDGDDLYYVIICASTILKYPEMVYSDDDHNHVNNKMVEEAENYFFQSFF